MKRLLIPIAAMMALAVQLVSCDDGMTYAEMVEEERDIIARFLSDSGFYYVENFPADSFANDKEFMLTTDGIYMRVEDFGDGRAFESGDEVTVRFTEVNLSNQLTISNDVQGGQPDVFRYELYGSTQSGIFIGDSYMATIYSSTAVPSGWLMPLEYVRDGSHVRLIVPHDLGQTDASYYVYPCYYELYYGIAKR